jgi:carbamoyltransferase
VEKTNRHHLLHAYAASVMASEGPSLVLINDGRGCRPQDNGAVGADSMHFEVESVYWHDKGRITDLEKAYRPYFNKKYPWGSHIDSLGYAYGAVSKKLFGSANVAGKVMALAALSERAYNFPEPFIFGEGRSFAVNPDWLLFLQGCPEQVAWYTPLAADLAHAIQKGVERYSAFRTKSLARKYLCKDFLLGGGVALNCKNNGLLANSEWIRSVNVFPACGDDGLSVGAAVWALRERFDDYRPISYHVSQGARYDDGIAAPAELSAQISRLLAAGMTVGIHQGGSEFGPRALGYRSVLSSAKELAFKIRLNEQIKHRESFRPFGGIVLHRNLERLTDDALAGPNMLSAARIKDSIKTDYPALVHADDTIRLQVVNEDGGLLHRILSEYERITGRLALINTSFNGRDEPIVETVSQAKSCAEKIGLDYMYAAGSLERIHA